LRAVVNRMWALLEAVYVAMSCMSRVSFDVEVELLLNGMR